MNKKKTMAIIGAGFAGNALAKAMEKRLPDGYRIGLISLDNFITYNPLLAEVVGASIPPAHAVAPVRQIVKKSYFYMVDVTDIDYQSRVIY
ncbi:MAG: NADH dehydrogenase [Patiriisocius sp.]|jgi:NADH dehydrogenase